MDRPSWEHASPLGVSIYRLFSIESVFIDAQHLSLSLYRTALRAWKRTGSVDGEVQDLESENGGEKDGGEDLDMVASRDEQRHGSYKEEHKDVPNVVGGGSVLRRF